MTGTDDLIARLKKKAIDLLEHHHVKAGWLMQEAATALTEQAARIERLTRERDEEAETAAANGRFLCARAETAERERDEARAEVERLREAPE